MAGTLGAILALGLGAVTAVAQPPGDNGNGKPDHTGPPADTQTTTAPADPGAVPGQDGVLPGNSGNTPAADRPAHPEHPEQAQNGEKGTDGEHPEHPEQAANDGKLPPAEPPALGKQVKVGAVAGTVKVRLPGGSADVPLDDPASLPVGSVIDARQGTVELTSAADASGTAQTAQFRGGRFSVAQAAAGSPVTELRLRGGSFAACPRASTARRSGVMATASASRSKKVRSLWGSGKGRFRTKGRHSAATVRGTVWEVTDRCDGTLTRVHSGVVEVRDAVRKKTVLVRKGKTYLARARR